LIVVFEDLHWIDAGTQVFLNLLVDALATARSLLLVNYRPEYRHDWGNKTYYTQLRLDPLGKESAEEMLTTLLGDGAELGPLKWLIIEKTEGNPFFMEETVQVLLDEGALVRNVTVKLTKALGELKIPPTVQGILAARIDRLPADEKELLQALAIIGKEFRLGPVKQVVGKPDDELQRILSDLQLAEFIYEQPAVADIEYIFKHALTQEVAYGSLFARAPPGDARPIEALYEGRLEEHLAELAHHYRHTSKIEKAVHYLRLAAGQAADRSALSEAESQLRDAIALLMALPASSERDLTELTLQTTLASLLAGRSSRGSPERETVLRCVYEVSERIADPREVLPALFQLGQL
jgi:predicted ATPase